MCTLKLTSCCSFACHGRGAYVRRVQRVSCCLLFLHRHCCVDSPCWFADGRPGATSDVQSVSCLSLTSVVGHSRCWFAGGRPGGHVRPVQQVSCLSLTSVVVHSRCWFAGGHNYITLPEMTEAARITKQIAGLKKEMNDAFAVQAMNPAMKDNVEFMVVQYSRQIAGLESQLNALTPHVVAAGAGAAAAAALGLAPPKPESPWLSPPLCRGQHLSIVQWVSRLSLTPVVVYLRQPLP
jgi:outer membrane murein-binding lipoprotein Lpp